MSRDMSRRSFLVGTAALSGGSFGLGYWARSQRRGRELKTYKAPELREDPLLGTGRVLVAQGPDPALNVQRALEASRVIDKLVSRGDTVVLKPNMAWNLPPGQGANANPATVGALVMACRKAAGPGGKVIVFDRAMSNPAGPYKTSGIADAVRQAGGTVHFVDESRFHTVEIPDSFALRSWSFYEKVLFADSVDVLINIPATKTHSTSGLTLGMKNVFGMVGGARGHLHQQIHEKIADLNRVVKVDLTVLDATRVMFRGGPNSPRRADVDSSPGRAQRIVIGTDPVAVDAYAATLFDRDPADVGFLEYGQEAGLGTYKFAAQEV